MKLTFEDAQHKKGGLGTVAATEKQENIFDQKLRNFLDKHKLNLDTSHNPTTIEEARDSDNKKIVENFTIVKSFPLNSERSVVMAYQNDTDQLLAMKGMSEKDFDEIAVLHNLGDTSVEEYLEKKGFADPNIVLPKKTIKKDGRVYRFYEILDINLEKYLESHNQIPIEDSVVLIMHACMGMASLHKADVVYVDFAPLNTMLATNTLKLIDLDGSSIDTEGNGIYHRNYNRSNRFISAPELFAEQPTFDKTVDIYAAAANLYRLIVGHWPYDIEETMWKNSNENKREAYRKLHMEGKIVFPESIPQNIKSVIEKGMSPNHIDRYQSMEEFMNALIDVVEN